MSSNSSETESPPPVAAVPAIGDTVADLLVESLRLMRVQVPPCHVRTREALSGAAIRCRVDEEVFTVSVPPGSEEIAIGPAQPYFTVDVRTSRRTILDLVHGAVGLLDAVRANDLHIRGAVALVERLSRAMTAYLHGAARSQSFPGLLARLQRIDEARR